MSTYVFGDLQGCFDEFGTLLNKIRFKPGNDSLWFVGDLVNRGPKNRETLDFILRLPEVTTVLGNHDLHFLAVATDSHEITSKDTFQDLLDSPDLGHYIDWYRRRPLLYQEKQYILVHAGLPPHWDLDTCLVRASEVEKALKGDDYETFLEGMYSSEPAPWRDDLKGIDRLRMITNYFTRMRFCTIDGNLEFTHKTTVAPQGYSPWFRHPNRIDDEKRILFGHWAALEGSTQSKKHIALDTGCSWGRSLTAYCLEDGSFFSTPAISTVPNWGSPCRSKPSV